MADRRANTGSRVPWRSGLTAVVGLGLAATALAVDAEARRAERKHPPSGSFIEVNGVRLHYQQRGAGPAIVLLHGNGSMAADFECSGLIDSLASAYRVICFDRPGYGYSTRPRSRLWTPNAQADLICAALLRLGVQHATFLGHSWGTLVALAAALDHPKLVRGLVLLSGYYFAQPRLDVALFAPPAIPIFGDIIRYTLSPVLGALIARPMVRKQFAPRKIPQAFDAAFPVKLTLRPWHIRASAEEAAIMIPAAASLQKRYRELDTPITLVAGAGDRIVDVEKHSVRLHRQLPQAELHVLPGLGHMLHYFAQDRVAEAIDRITRA